MKDHVVWREHAEIVIVIVVSESVGRIPSMSRKMGR